MKSCFLTFFKLAKNEIHVFWGFLSLEKMKFMFFKVFKLSKKMKFMLFKKSINYQCRTFGERRRTRTQPDDPYCELSICHSSVLIRARHDCTVRDLLCFETQHGTPLEIMRTRSVRLGRVHKQCTTILLKKHFFCGQFDLIPFCGAPRFWGARLL